MKYFLFCQKIHVEYIFFLDTLGVMVMAVHKEHIIGK